MTRSASSETADPELFHIVRGCGDDALGRFPDRRAWDYFRNNGGVGENVLK